MLAASVTVMDPIALSLIQRYGGQFGRERLFSTVGMALFSPLIGWLIDYTSAKKGKLYIRSRKWIFLLVLLFTKK